MSYGLWEIRRLIVACTSRLKPTAEKPEDSTPEARNSSLEAQGPRVDAQSSKLIAHSSCGT